MRRLRFTLLAPVGDQEMEVERSLVELLDAIPYLLLELIPPLKVVNQVLATGCEDAGMSGGCRWEPFQITEDEYREVVEVLEARTGENALRFVEPPAWVVDREEWSIWCAEYLWSIPAGRNRELRGKMKRIEEEMNEARQAGRHEVADGLLSQLSQVAEEWSTFVQETRRPKHS